MRSSLLQLSIVILCTLALGCSGIGRIIGEEDLETKNNKELALLEKGQERLDSGDYISAQSIFDEFAIQFPGSAYYLRSQLGKAQSLEGQSLWTEAIEVYRGVSRQFKQNPQLAAEALYRLSYCYESLGESEKAIATLLDAQKQAQHLNPIILKAEIPARLASAYMRLGNQKLAFKYFELADQGYRTLSQGEIDTTNKNWRAEVLYRMGSFPVEALSPKNYESFLESLILAQVYLVAAIDQNHEIWSPRALDHLKSTYLQLWHRIEQLELRQTEDPGYALVEYSETKRKMLAEFLSVVSQLKQQQILESNQNSYAENLWNYTEELESQAKVHLEQLPVRTGLTPEAMEKMSLRRNYRLVSPERPLQSESDPNL